LGEGGLKQNVQSLMKFKEGNQIEFEAHFGCTMFTFEKAEKGVVGELYDLFASLSIDKDDPRWKEQRSVFATFNLNMEFEFGKNAVGFDSPILDSLGAMTGINGIMDSYKKTKQRAPFVYAKLVDFKP